MASNSYKGHVDNSTHLQLTINATVIVPAGLQYLIKILCPTV